MIGYRYQLVELGTTRRVIAVRPSIAELRYYAIGLDDQKASWVVFDKLKQVTISRDETFAVWKKLGLV